MKKISTFVLCALLLIINTVGSSETNRSGNTLKFNKVTTVIIDSLEADIQFILSDVDEVSIKGESKMLSSLLISPTSGVLKVSAGRYSDGALTKLQVVVPSTCLLDISVVGNSHVFIPRMNAPVRISQSELSEVTIESCAGLVLTASGATKTQVNQINGDISGTLSERSALGIKKGELKKALITATEYSRVSIGSSIQSLNLTTKGAADIKLAAITEAFMWTGRGNERVSIKRLSGIAEVAANYDSVLTVDAAALDTLLASASATGKIIIKGSVTNAALSSRGASQIMIDKVTGKILRNSQMHNGSIKILNP